WWGLAGRATPVRTTLVTESAGGADAAPAVLNASGYVTARRQATVSSKVTGKVEEVLVEEGMRVVAGQVLARLDDRQVRLSLDLAAAQLAAAERGLEETVARQHEVRLREGRLRELAAEGITPQADLDAVEAERSAIDARIATQREQIRAAGRALAIE